MIVNCRKQGGKLFDSTLNFSHLLIWGLSKGLKTDYRFFGVLIKESSVISENFREL